MISSVKGTLLQKQPTTAVVEVAGIGLEIGISVYTFESLGQPGAAVSLLTYLHVREDALQLFGFRDETERKLFLALTSISGIGPRLGMGILSGVDANTLCTLIRQGDVARLKKVPGVGPKTAERLILEMKGKIDKIVAPSSSQSAALSKPFEEALVALQSLGYKQPGAQAALDAIARESGTDLSIEEAIRLALKRLM